MPLKYAKVAQVGDRIRSYDFRGRTDCYVEGRVLDAHDDSKGFSALKILVDKDVWKYKDHDSKNVNRVGIVFYVPLELEWGEYDGRVVNLTRLDCDGGAADRNA